MIFSVFLMASTSKQSLINPINLRNLCLVVNSSPKRKVKRENVMYCENCGCKCFVALGSVDDSLIWTPLQGPSGLQIKLLQQETRVSKDKVQS